jgi:orotidine-5'-phosphate decarboxylase
MTPPADPRDRLIVALDLKSPAEARAMVKTLGDSVSFYKIGMELTYGGGLLLVEDLAAQGKKVFLDLKLHDIGHTVARATEQVAALGATFLTVHAFPQTMRAAIEGRGTSTLRILAVTVLTSYTEDDLKESGYGMSVADLVALRARAAQSIGIDGLVMSPEEVGAMRAMLGQGMTIVTPGIRPSGAALGDQKRVMTPAAAIAAGADHLVVGRPITQAEDPKGIAMRIVEEIAAVHA